MDAAGTKSQISSQCQLSFLEEGPILNGFDIKVGIRSSHH